MQPEPIPLRECVKQWRDYKAKAEGKPVPELKEQQPEEGYAALGCAVAKEMAEDPVFFRLVMGKLVSCVRSSVILRS
jgi:hypothetical protein